MKLVALAYHETPTERNDDNDIKSKTPPKNANLVGTEKFDVIRANRSKNDKIGGLMKEKYSRILH